MNATQMIGAALVVLGAVCLAVALSARLRMPEGHTAGLARADGLFPAGAGLSLIGIVLIAR